MSSGGRKKPVFVPDPRLTVRDLTDREWSSYAMPGCGCARCRAVRKFHAAVKRAEEAAIPSEPCRERSPRGAEGGHR